MVENKDDLRPIEKSDLVRVFVKGGIISPGDFNKIIQVAHEQGSAYVHLGSRQDILFPVVKKHVEVLDKTFQSINIGYDTDKEAYQNIVTSYTSLDVMPTTQWLASHIYHYILDTFDYQPKLKINITDPVQNLVPLFTGNVNFVASRQENYWYMFLRFSEINQKPWCAPMLFFGFELAQIAKRIEDLDPLASNLGYESIYQKAMEGLKLNCHPWEEELQFTETITPYYEGMNRIAGGKYWLGLYWRNNKFSISFLKALCKLCMETNIGTLSLTPWKSLIVRGISEKERLSWEKLLGKFGINIRHSALELNWHIPVLNKEALDIKDFLVRALDKQDISTYGLSFSIKVSRMVLFTAIVIEKCIGSSDKDPVTFNVMYAKGFNPNQSEYFYFVKNIPLAVVPTVLIELSQKYYDQWDEDKLMLERKKEVQVVSTNRFKRFQCASCLTVYDEAIGDPASGIQEGTSFSKLGQDYSCPVCDSPKSAYREV
ncbi:rubredoxin [Belliella sp. DSM 111904]|uniref:Rubredoxin n=1 Tax=Belliella filtrata TaxID=2923435 RepID=A0ABS9UZK7_9BACT|nr:rubredoxin [Belliella filtrata]MCH7409513.1 rubredoxin [Belliella filtrata]